MNIIHMGKGFSMVGLNSNSYSGIESLAAATQQAGSTLTFRQLGRGSIEASTWLGQSDGYLLNYLQATKAVEAEGNYPKGLATLNIPIGNMVLTQNGTFAQEGEWIFVPADSESFAHSGKSLGGAVLLFHFPSSLLDSRSAALAPGMEMPASSATKLFPGTIRALQFLHLARRLQQTDGEDIVEESFAAMISLLVDVMLDLPNAQAADNASWRSSQAKLRAAREYIESNLSVSFRLAEMCQQLNISHRTLNRLFRTELGMTPHQYLEARRLNEIRRTISEDPDNRKSTATIAMDHGLFHLGRFSSQFKRQFGLTPGECRRESCGNMRSSSLAM